MTDEILFGIPNKKPKRNRATKTGLLDRRSALLEIVFDSRAKKFGPISVELDAIDPNTLRSLVDEVISRHLSGEQYQILIEAEKKERHLFVGLADMVKRLGGRGVGGAI